VVFTTIAVAAATHGVLGLPWPAGFVLGAIVSPPDAMAPLSIARRMQLPRRILVILEGEGLANDATALILYRFAVAAVSAGEFSLGQAGVMFAAIVTGEIVWGIGVGWLILRLRPGCMIRASKSRFRFCAILGLWPQASGLSVCSPP
jgi:CPA1 family monovalent cation:H+ antiporter